MKRVTALIIAIDGPAASGKSTTARLVADRLAYTYIDSGAMYRAVALRALRLGVSDEDRDALTRVAVEASLELTGAGSSRVLLDGEDVTAEIRTEQVTESASVISTVPGVRRALVRRQREIGHSNDCVMEGRDIGSVVFPDADLKIFLVADLDARARRRLFELRERGLVEADESEDGELLGSLAGDLSLRDERDSTRKDSPLVKASDAVELDTTDMSIEEQVEEVVRLAVARGAVDRGSERARRP